MNTTKNSDSERPEESFFRQILPSLQQSRKNTPDWPHLLLPLLEREFLQQRRNAVAYTGAKLLVDKDDKDHTTAEPGLEKSVTRLLFKLCRESTSGVLTVGDDKFWLCNYEVPNFSNRSKQCADLVGVSATGGLVVFECKLRNSYAPLTSLVEGLDYLSCLTAEPNFTRLKKEFHEWRSKSNQLVPAEFESVTLTTDARHEVIVLGSEEYFDPYRRSKRGEGWQQFSRLCQTWNGVLGMRYAQTDFQTTKATWITE